MNKIKVTYFFRKPFTDYFSIEELFGFIQSALPANISFSNYYMKKTSKGLKNRLFNIFDSAKNQGQINHITGDVHFIAYLMKKSKTVLTIHDMVPLQRSSGLKRAVLKFFWYTLAAKKVGYITVISEFTKKSLLKEISFPEDRIYVIHNCISSEIKYVPKVFNKEKPNILQLGTAHNKNLENVVPALKGLNVKLTILGNLNDKQKELLKKYNIDYDNVYNLDYKDVIAQYEKADLVTFTSVYEGFGLPIIEANGVGRPIIAGNNTSQPEVAGDSAILVDPHNREEIRNSIIKIIEDDNFRNDLIEKGKKNVLRFRPEFVGKKYAELYETIAQRNS